MIDLSILAAGRFVAAAFAAVSLAGCAASPEPGWQAALEAMVHDRSESFGPVVDDLLVPQTDGVVDAVMSKAAPADGRLAVGDALLFGVRLDTGSATRLWYLRLSVTAIDDVSFLRARRLQPFQERVTVTVSEAEAQAGDGQRGRRISGGLGQLHEEGPVARIAVEAFNASGQSLGSELSSESVARLESGLFAACVAGDARRDVMRGRAALGEAAPMLEVDVATYVDLDIVSEGVSACDSFFTILESNPVTRRILYEVIRLPSLWSMVTHLGVDTGFGIDFFAAERVEPSRFPDEAGQLWSVPMTVELNDQPALLARLIAGRARGASAVAAGVFGFVARHPSDPDRRVHVQRLGWVAKD